MGFTIEPYVSRHQRTVMGKTMAYIDEGHGECHPLPTWQPHLVVSVTQHHAAPGGAEPARRLRSAGYGRIRQTQCIGPRQLHRHANPSRTQTRSCPQRYVRAGPARCHILKTVGKVSS
jgi:hypothetical protein